MFKNSKILSGGEMGGGGNFAGWKLYTEFNEKKNE